MTRVVWTNNASATLASSVSSTQTTITLSSGQGALFPNPSSGQFFPLTLISASNANAFEITYCTARSTDTLTIERAQEGTTGLAFNVDDLANLLPTAGTIVPHGCLLNVQAFGNPGTTTYTPTAGMSFVIGCVVGGGGGSGGLPTCNSAQYAFSAGASSGSMAVGLYTAATIGASQAVTVGVGGAAGASGGGNGGAGGASSFGSIAVAPGGLGTTWSGPAGFALIAVGPSLPGAVATGGNILNMQGLSGVMSLGGTTLSASASVAAIGGAGGASPLGANGPGFGGGGAAIENSSAVPGNAGGSGIIIVYEFS